MTRFIVIMISLCCHNHFQLSKSWGTLLCWVDCVKISNNHIIKNYENLYPVIQTCNLRSATGKWSGQIGIRLDKQREIRQGTCLHLSVDRVLSWHGAGLQRDGERWTLCSCRWCWALAFSQSWWAVFIWCQTFKMKILTILSSPFCCCCLHSPKPKTSISAQMSYVCVAWRTYTLLFWTLQPCVVCWKWTHLEDT